MLFARTLAMSALWAVLVVPWALASYAGVTTLEFDRNLPPGAEFSRSSPAIGPRGDVLAADVPRFQLGAVTPGATRVTALPLSDQVLASKEIDAVQYTLVRTGTVPKLTSGEPGADPPPAYGLPHPSLVGRFGYAGSVWGWPCAAEILPDGSVILHTFGGGSEWRSMTLRTTLASFSDPDGFELVRVSDYRPPTPSQATFVDAVYPRRSLYLPNLGVWASTISEYAANGLVSSVYAGAGRDLGWASIDSGRTWQRVIDSDLDVPDRVLEPTPKHMHHLEAFEWFDAGDATWKFGVIAAVGDGNPTPEQGQIVARARTATPPDLPAETYASVARLKARGADQLTDVFPLSSSGTPSFGPVLLGGPDGTQAGMTTMFLQGDVQHDAVVFRPTVTLARWPAVLQLGRLGNGSIAVPTVIFSASLDYHAAGIWTADPTGTQWATAFLTSLTGFLGIIPVGRDRFWTSSDRGDGVYESSLWELPGPPSLRSSLLLEPAASDVPIAPAFASNGSVSTAVVSGVAPPVRVGDDREILHVRSESLSLGQRFDSLALQELSAAPGQVVQLSFWVKPVPADLAVVGFRTLLELRSPAGESTFSESVWVDLDLNDWTPIMVTCRAPAAGTSRAAARFSLVADASATLPLDYYFTEPQLVVSDQPTIGTYRRAETTAGEQLTVQLPPLSADWSVAVWATEAPNLVLSLLDPSGSQALVQQTDVSSERAVFALSSAFAFSSWSPTSGMIEVGELARRNVMIPTQDLVVITQSDGQLTLYVARGMGPLETLEGGGFEFAPTELRFASPAWDRLFEGSVQRVKVWDDTALDLADVEAERVSMLPVLPPACGIGPELALLLPALMWLHRRARR